MTASGVEETDVTTDSDNSVRYVIPNAWRAMKIMAEAMNLLETNPDLVGEDVRLALESETPAAADLLNACIANHLQLVIAQQGAEAYAKIVAQRVARAKALVDRSKTMVGGLLLALKQHDGPWRAPGGSASLRKSPSTIIVTDEKRVPEQFTTTATTTTTTIDKRAIARWLKEHPDQAVDGIEQGNGPTIAIITG